MMWRKVLTGDIRSALADDSNIRTYNAVFTIQDVQISRRNRSHVMVQTEIRLAGRNSASGIE